MIIPGIPFLIGMFGVCYLILTLQVNARFPPFYEKVNINDEMKLDLPYFFGLVATLAASALFRHLLVL